MHRFTRRTHKRPGLKLLCLLLVTIMIVSLFGMTAFATSAQPEQSDSVQSTPSSVQTQASPPDATPTLAEDSTETPAPPASLQADALAQTATPSAQPANTALKAQGGAVRIQGQEGSYPSISAALAIAPAGATLVLDENVSETATIEISSGVTINGNGNTLTSAATPMFNITTDDSVTVSSVRMEGSQRAFNLSSNSPQLTLTGCDIAVSVRGISFVQDGIAQNAAILLDNTIIHNSRISDYETNTTIGDTRGISIFDVKDSSVTLRNGSAIKGFGYSINLSGNEIDGVADASGLVVTVDGSTISGWTTFNVWSSNVQFNIRNSTLLGINPSTGSWDSFSTIVVNDDIYGQFQGSTAKRNSFDISNTTIKNYVTPTAAAAGTQQQLFRIDADGITAIKLNDVRFVDTTGAVDSAFYSPRMDAADLAKYLDERVTMQNVTVQSPDGTLSVYPCYVRIGDHYYPSIQQAVDAADPDSLSTKRVT